MEDEEHKGWQQSKVKAARCLLPDATCTTCCERKSEEMVTEEREREDEEEKDTVKV